MMRMIVMIVKIIEEKNRSQDKREHSHKLLEGRMHNKNRNKRFNNRQDQRDKEKKVMKIQVVQKEKRVKRKVTRIGMMQKLVMKIQKEDN